MDMEKKLACDVDNNGNISDFGIPVIAEHGANNKRYADLLGLQFGWTFKQIAENVFQNQFGNKFSICSYEN